MRAAEPPPLPRYMDGARPEGVWREAWREGYKAALKAVVTVQEELPTEDPW